MAIRWPALLSRTMSPRSFISRDWAFIWAIRPLTQRTAEKPRTPTTRPLMTPSEAIVARSDAGEACW